MLYWVFVSVLGLSPVTARDSLLLATLSYQIGPSKLLGNSKYPKSVVLKKLENGDRNVETDYIKFSHWNGKHIPDRKSVV